MWNFDGQNVIVTGAGRGIGRAAALGFAMHGAAVAALDIDVEAAEETVGLLPSNGQKHVAVRCDVAHEPDVLAAVTEAEQRLGALDVLFNNAGVTRRLPIAEWTQKDWEALLAVNFIGVYTMTRAVGLRMVERRRGTIVNMSALGGGCVGLGRGSQIYTGTKGAVVAMTRDFAADWARFGVRVNCVAPGWIETDMNAPLLADERARERVIQRVPLGRWGLPEDVVGPVLFLASDYARYVTGHLLPIDGGANCIIQLTTDDVIR